MRPLTFFRARGHKVREGPWDLDMSASALVPAAPFFPARWACLSVSHWSLQAPFLCLSHLPTIVSTPRKLVLSWSPNHPREEGELQIPKSQGLPGVPCRAEDSPLKADVEEGSASPEGTPLDQNIRPCCWPLRDLSTAQSISHSWEWPEVQLVLYNSGS